LIREYKRVIEPAYATKLITILKHFKTLDEAV